MITVWDSEEQFNEFRDSTLIPAMQEGGFGDRVAPRITTQPVYNVADAMHSDMLPLHGGAVQRRLLGHAACVEHHSK